MKRYSVLVSGVGALIGYGIIKSLRQSRYNVSIVGMDIYDDAVGAEWCDTFIRAVPAKDGRYIAFVKDVFSKHSIDLMFFGTEQEIQRLSAAKDELGEIYDRLAINNSEIIELAKDKYKMYSFQKDHNLQGIPSVIDGTFEEVSGMFGTPFLIKPTRSYASKGIVVIDCKEDFDFWKKKTADHFMAQPIIGDEEHEYTASVFGYGDGTCSQLIVFWRKLSGEGATSKARSVNIPEIDMEINKYVHLLKPVGPTNFQFRRHDGQYLLLEINPRISSSTSIRAALGYNEAEMSIAFYVENKRIIPDIKNGQATRYITEVVKIS